MNRFNNSSQSRWGQGVWGRRVQRLDWDDNNDSVLQKLGIEKEVGSKAWQITIYKMAWKMEECGQHRKQIGLEEQMMQ